MGTPIKTLKVFKGGGMDMDSAPEFVNPNDFITAYNVRVIGTSGGEQGLVTDIEGTKEIPFSLPPGLNKGLGGKGFDEIRKAVFAIYNSGGNHQIGVLDLDTNIVDIIYTDKTDSGGIQLLNWNPQHKVNFILINKTYLAWADGVSEVGFTNLNTLSSGGYGVVKAEDLSLIKPQNLLPTTAVYINDTGRAANFVKGKLFQFTSQYIGTDYNYSTWATWSKRIIPAQESTPSVGADVSANNGIVVTVNIGSDRVKTLNIACRYDNFGYNIIKTVERSYVTSLINTQVAVDNEVYEAYDPSANTYSFIFYNESLNIPVAPVETDQFVDYIWIANAIEKINGNIIALADLQVGYDRPTTKVTLQAVGYNPNLTVPSSANTDPLRYTIVNPGESGSGEGDHKRRITLIFDGQPQANDLIEIFMVDIRDANNSKGYPYTVPSSQANHLDQVIQSFSENIPRANWYINPDGTVTLTWVDDPYFTLRNAAVTIYSTGASVSKSIHAILDNSSYQLALSYRDKYGRPFPLETDNTFIVNTPSFAQLNGQTPQISWAINSANAPVGAVDYQWLMTPNNTVLPNGNLLDVMGSILNYKGGWDSKANTPTLAAGTGAVGDTYQVTTPNGADGTTNLGNGNGPFNSGDYVVYNGKSWDVVPKSFGDLTTTGNIMAIKINPLALFNQRYSNNGVDTILSYDYVKGDRATLHYYFAPGELDDKTYLNSPCVDLDVYGFDAASYLLKVEKSSAVSLTDLAGQDIFLRLYSPNTQRTNDASASTTTSQNTTTWYEIGERFTITNGLHDTLSGTITDGDVYFKTRSYNGGIDQNTVYDILATDFNFSDFYTSDFTSYGRPRSYYDILEKTEQKASIIYSENYILGSKVNGLTRFYQANLYGEGDGETSSSYGAIQVMWMRNDVLVVMQENHVGYIPVNASILEDAQEKQQYAISEKLLNNVRYSNAGNIGVGLTKAFCFYKNMGFIVDPNLSEPFYVGLDGVESLSGKLSKFFKATLQLAYAQGKDIDLYYNTYYNEVVLHIEAEGGVIQLFPFSAAYWQTLDPYNISPADVTNISTPANATVSYNTSTGDATFTPTAGFVGNNVVPFSFTSGGATITKNLCLNWTNGVTTIYQFSFGARIGQPVSTYILSNSILVNGNTVPVPISIVSGQYSINGGAFTTAAGMVNPGDSVQVEVMSSASNNTTTSTTLTIADKSGTFTVTTANGSTPLNPFDYLVVRVLTTNASGTDLDIAAGFTGTGTPYDIDYTGNNNWVGYNQTQANHNTVSVSGTPLYVQWGGDNTGSGVEAVLIDFKQLATDYPLLTSLTFLLYAIWYGTRASGDIQVQLETYLGGTMSKSGFDFTNTGGTAVDNITIGRNVANVGRTANINADQLVGTITYNPTTKAATLT
jgi:hypothetical protein